MRELFESGKDDDGTADGTDKRTEDGYGGTGTTGRTDRGRTTTEQTTGRTDGRSEDDDGDRTFATGQFPYLFFSLLYLVLSISDVLVMLRRCLDYVWTMPVRYLGDVCMLLRRCMYDVLVMFV